jgi:ubiquinone/menaquinone biosynthesis C-methylase UbiE
MVEIAEKRAQKLKLDVDLRIMEVENLEFLDDSFDTVVSSPSLCTFPDPVAALKEIRRVCKEGGRILLLEHGRCDREWIGRLQDFREEAHARQLGCHWNRGPLELGQEAGLAPVSTQRTFLGIFHEIEAGRSA